MSGRPKFITDKRDEAWKSGNLARVVRSFCFECMGGNGADVAGCTAPECPLYPFRLRRSVSDGFNEVCEGRGWPKPRAEHQKGVVPSGLAKEDSSGLE